MKNLLKKNLEIQIYQIYQKKVKLNYLKNFKILHSIIYNNFFIIIIFMFLKHTQNLLQREKDKNSTKSSFCSQTSTQGQKSQK